MPMTKTDATNVNVLLSVLLALDAPREATPERARLAAEGLASSASRALAAGVSAAHVGEAWSWPPPGVPSPRRVAAGPLHAGVAELVELVVAFDQAETAVTAAHGAWDIGGEPPSDDVMYARGDRAVDVARELSNLLPRIAAEYGVECPRAGTG